MLTDASVMEEGSRGSGNPIMKLARALGKVTILFQEEIYAILLAAEKYLRPKWRSRSIRICSFDWVMLLALKSNNISSQVGSCKQLLLKLGQLNKTSLMVVPGHSKIVGNEEAEGLVRQGGKFLFNEEFANSEYLGHLQYLIRILPC